MTPLADNKNALNQWLDTLNDPWIEDWNDMIRNVIFKDEILKTLMNVPAKTTIIDFTNNYFIRAGYTNKVLTDESVRIVYGIVGSNTYNPDVTKNQISFDIYVKNEDLHNVGRDRLVNRTQLIAKRLFELLMKQRYNGVYRFFSPYEGDMGTSAIGYSRYNASLSFMRTY